MQYVLVDDIIRMVVRHGRGALIAKFDVEAAYRNIPVSSSDRYLLGLKWRDQFLRLLNSPLWIKVSSLY